MNNNKKIVNCNQCGNNIIRYKCRCYNIKTFFCNIKCKALYQKQQKISLETRKKISESTKKEKNPNYNNRWTTEQKEKQSVRLKKIMKDPKIRAQCACNKGKKLPKWWIDKIHKNRTPESYSRPCTEKAKKLIGIKSKAKFTPEFKIEQRKKMEQSGYWVPLDKKPICDIYFKEANWVEKMFDRANKNECILLEKYKIFNSRTNSRGCVRDHIYSRKSGFKNKVFPEILRHPCNCQIITHSQNVSKAHKDSHEDNDGISLEELFTKILNYKIKWKEQNLCIDLIHKYKRGEKWEMIFI